MIKTQSTGAAPEKLLAKAFKLLSYRPRSEQELKQRGLAAAIPRLKQLALIDDQQFARWWVEQRCCFRPRGNIALRQELRQKGINQEIITSVLLPRDKELALAKKLLAKKNLDKTSAQRFLLSRGFSLDIVYNL